MRSGLQILLPLIAALFVFGQVVVSQTYDPDDLSLHAWSPLPGELSVMWGGSGLPPSSCSHFSRWTLSVTDTRRNIYHDVSLQNCTEPSSSPLTTYSQLHVCHFQGLHTDAAHLVELAEECAPVTPISWNASVVTKTRPKPASVPGDIEFLGTFPETNGSQLQAISIKWVASGNAGDCIFKEWKVESRPQQMPWTNGSAGAGEWVREENCTLSESSPRHETVCNLTGLAPRTGYQIRIAESCMDPLADGNFAYAPYPFFTAPGEFWATYVGSHPDWWYLPNFNAGSPLTKCKAVKECCHDQFSFCYSGQYKQLVTIARVDAHIVDSGGGGWGQKLKLYCQSHSSQPFLPYLNSDDKPYAPETDVMFLQPEVGPTAPTRLWFMESTANTVIIRFDFRDLVINTCECAVPQVQLKPIGSSHPEEWQDTFADIGFQDCADMGARECQANFLYPDTRYVGRIRLSCSNNVTGAWRDSEDSFVTMPGCAFDTHSGYPNKFECIDGTFCDMSDDTCCNSKGGRYRCPQSHPHMCENTNDCAASTDHCCKMSREDCEGHGGVRQCPIPAKSPTIVSFGSLAPASISITWQKEEYLSGDSSDCQHYSWRVHYAKVYDWGQGPWLAYRGCWWPHEHANFCQLNDLESMTPYHVQVKLTCTDTDLNSMPARTSAPVVTRPHPALPPKEVMCHLFEPESFSAFWYENDPRDCTFYRWELQIKLLPRAARRNELGIYEKAEPGGNYSTRCLLYSRDEKDCYLDNLLANREYFIRVAERCSDPFADSEYKRRYLPCQTLTMPAKIPTNISISKERLYTFEVSWIPGDPKACIFVAWEVQVIWNASDTPEWAQTHWGIGEDYLTHFGCMVTVREKPNCTVNLGLNSGRLWYVRMREVCSERRLFSPWLYHDATIGANTLFPEPAGAPTNTYFISAEPYWNAPVKIYANWTAGAINDCVFTGWRVEFKPSVDQSRLMPDQVEPSSSVLKWKRFIEAGAMPYLPWKISAECASRPRLPTECLFDQEVETNTWYDIRLRETCLDTNALGHATYIKEALRTRPVRAENPIIQSVFPANSRAITTMIIPGDPGDCYFVMWRVEWMLQGSNEWELTTECTLRTFLECTVRRLPKSYSYYSIRIKEQCSDPMADSQWVYYLPPFSTRTWPEPAMTPTNVTADPVLAYEMTVSWDLNDGRDCTFVRWEMQIVEGFYSKDPEYLEPIPPWRNLDECDDQIVPRVNTSCRILRLSSYTLYSVRVREICTDPIFNSFWGYMYPTFTAMPIPAGVPKMFRVSPVDKSRFWAYDSRELAIYAFFFDVRWTPGAMGQCNFKRWQLQSLVEAVDGVAEPGSQWVEEECDRPRVNLEEGGPLFEEQQCRVARLDMNTTYRSRIRELCTDPNANGDWAYLSQPDVVTTLVANVGATEPENLTVSNETAYTFVLEWDAGVPNECYFTGWDVEVRENFTYPNITCDNITCTWWNEPEVEANATPPFANMTEWISRWECSQWAVWPRPQPGSGVRGYCVVPRLHGLSVYDARVRETCYSDYTKKLNSPWSFELPDRQAVTLRPIGATAPSNLIAWDPGPYDFKVRWTPGEPNDCLFDIMKIEIKAKDYTGDHWLTAEECGHQGSDYDWYSNWAQRKSVERRSRIMIDCKVTIVLPPHVRSNTVYDIRVTEVCKTYSSVHDPVNEIPAPDLDSPTIYIPSAGKPQTLIPVRAAKPTDLKRVQEAPADMVTGMHPEEETSGGFKLAWNEGVLNDCRFLNWNIEVRQKFKCFTSFDYFSCDPTPSAEWLVVPACQTRGAPTHWAYERGRTSCLAAGMVESYSLYEVRLNDSCTDPTAQSYYTEIVTETWPQAAGAPINFTVASAEGEDVAPFWFELKWLGGERGECLYTYWDVQYRLRLGGSAMNKWYGEIENTTNLTWSDTVEQCRWDGYYNRENGTIFGCTIRDLESNAFYDLRIRERCNDTRADSAWTYAYLQRTEVARARAPVEIYFNNTQTTTIEVNWTAQDGRDCIFTQWKVEVKPSPVEDWILVPECMWHQRSRTNCTIIGLHSSTEYDIRIREECRHPSADGFYGELKTAFQTEVGTIIYVGSNPLTNEKEIPFHEPYNACAYQLKCCVDEFAVCYKNDKTGISVMRTDLPDNGWGQDLYISCIQDETPIDDMKRLKARPVSTFKPIKRENNQLTVQWLPYGTGGYMSDCYCTVWTIQIRNHGTEQWYDSIDCTNLPFAQSSCTIRNHLDFSLEYPDMNWLYPDTIYDLRIQQTCLDSHLSSEYREITATTVPGCNFSTHTGQVQALECVNGVRCPIWEDRGECCNYDGRGGRNRCPSDLPYMCNSPDDCAQSKDHCCRAEPCGHNGGGDRICTVRPNAPANIHYETPNPTSMIVSWEAVNFNDPDYSPCIFQSWEVLLARRWSPTWQAEWIEQQQCRHVNRYQTSCEVHGLQHYAHYYIKVRELCVDDEKNGDFGYIPGWATVHPLPATSAIATRAVKRFAESLLVTWDPGESNDCAFRRWLMISKEALDPNAAPVYNYFATRSPVLGTMVGLKSETLYHIGVIEECLDPRANSREVFFTVRTKPWFANHVLNLRVDRESHIGMYSMQISWSAGNQGGCLFSRWDVQLKVLSSKGVPGTTDFKRGHGEPEYPLDLIANDRRLRYFMEQRQQRRQRRLSHHDQHPIDLDTDKYIYVPQCGENFTAVPFGGKESEPSVMYKDIKCNITETFRCDRDTAYQGYASFCIPGVECPYIQNVPTLFHCQMLCSQHVRCYAMTFRDTEKACRLVDSSWRPLPDDPKHNSTGCAKAIGLPSNSTFAVRVREICVDQEANSGFSNLTKLPWQPNLYIQPHTLIGRATAVEEMTADPLGPHSAVVQFQPGSPNDTLAVWPGFPHVDVDDWTDCTFQSWYIESKINGTDDWFYRPSKCVLSEMEPRRDRSLLKTLRWEVCEVTGFNSSEFQLVRAQERCVDPAANGPFNAYEVNVTTPYAIPAGIVTNITAEGGMVAYDEDAYLYNATINLSWDPGEPNDCLFVAWDVWVRLSKPEIPFNVLHMEEEWIYAHECKSASQYYPNCTLMEVGLEFYEYYDIRIVTDCWDPKARSVDAFKLFRTLPLPAEKPFMSLKLTANSYEIGLTWYANNQHNCVFSSWEVWANHEGSNFWYSHSTQGTLPWVCQGYDSLGSPSSCTLTNRLSRKDTTVRVCQKCTDPMANSACAEGVIYVPAGVAAAPFNFELLERERMDAQFGFTPGILRDCQPTSFRIEASNSTNDTVTWVWAADCPYQSTTTVISTTTSTTTNTTMTTTTLATTIIATTSATTTTPQPQQTCALTGLDPETSYVLRVSTLCLDEDANGYPSDPFYIYGLHDAILSGGIVLHHARRLTVSANNDEASFIKTVKETIAMLLNIPAKKVAVSRNDMNVAVPNGETHLNFVVAIAQVMVEINLFEAEEIARGMLGILSGHFNTSRGNVSFTDALSHYIGEGVTVEVSSMPQLRVLDGVLPGCGPPEPVNLMSPDWSPQMCAGRDWHYGPCVVPCRTGYWSDGAYECSVDAVWQGSPRCVPEWVVGAWSTCNSTCGPGMQQRTVWCPVGDECERARPSDQQQCYATAGCEWQVQAWEACSTQCGVGMKTRSVTCSSAFEVDCENTRPASRETCEVYLDCKWQFSPWGACTNLCGAGTHTRTVWCEADNFAHCGQPAPATVGICQNTAGCSWLTSNWSSCSSTCGQGTLTRSVWCSSGNDDDCSQLLRPAMSESCQSIAACAWNFGAWSQCSSTCGQGVSNRTATCPSGRPSDCPAESLLTHQACYSTQACQWQAGPWSACSNSCGEGTSTRSVSCVSGRDVDCGGIGQQPVTQTICHGSSGCPSTIAILNFTPCSDLQGCSWMVGNWSDCSSSCGHGATTRRVVCESGFDADCHGVKPIVNNSCLDNSGCGWVLGAWSACSNDCGSGNQHRTVRCATGNDADCGSVGPAAQRDCHGTSGCSWVIGAWSDCNTSCGHGLRSRTVACASGVDIDCVSSRPSSHETCVVAPDCQWQVSQWTSCSNACGGGTKSRELSCPSGHDADCPQAVPLTLESCSSTSGCTWYMSDWSACSVECGQGIATRTVLCPTGVDSHCSGLRPDESQTCSGTQQCEWQVGEWSGCVSQCGLGVQVRNVTCSSGHSADCPSNAPLAQQSCHTFAGCSWSVGNWSKCSSSCGPGTMTRIVGCTSNDDGDCANLDKPIEEQACENIDSSCEWAIGEWGDCTATYCGSSGTRSRSVSCPSSFGDAACPFPRPAAAEFCILRSPRVSCPWRIFNWSGCQTECGSGIEVRDVTCSSTNASDCFEPKPTALRTCESSVGCGWTTGPWSTCSSSCGAGVQMRSISCIGDDCGAQGPSKVKPCYATESCVWIKDDWSDCDTACGNGLKSRNVACSSGVDEDCASFPKPADQAECRGSICDWIASAWSLCSVLCGFGSQHRSVSCFSGYDADCQGSAKPITVQSCNETAGCSWRTLSWGACLVSCGSGVKQREVWCPGAVGLDCNGKKPEVDMNCSEYRGCNSTMGSWSTCSTQCGAGLQQRHVSCVEEGTCLGDSVDTTQECRSSIGCAWKVSPWSACSSAACGEGLRTRSVVCEGGDARACVGTTPIDTEACSDLSGCQWRMGGWSNCEINCAPQSRLVDCPTGSNADCPVGRPETVRLCNHASCIARGAWHALDVQYVFLFSEALSGEEGAGIMEAVRGAHSEALEVDLADLVVKIADERRLDTEKRQMAGFTPTSELRLLVQISHPTAGHLAFVSLETGQQLIWTKISSRLVQEGLPMYHESSFLKGHAVRMPPDIDIPENISMGREENFLGNVSASENLGGAENLGGLENLGGVEDGGTSVILVLVMVALSVAVSCISAVGLRRWRAWMKETTKVQHCSLEKASQDTSRNSEDSSDSDPGSPSGEKALPKRSMLWWRRLLLRWAPAAFASSARKHVRLKEEPSSSVEVAPSPTNSTCISVVAQSPLKKKLEYAFVSKCSSCGAELHDDETVCVRCGSKATLASSSRDRLEDTSSDGTTSTRPPSSYSQATGMSALRSLAAVEDEHLLGDRTPVEPICVRTPPHNGRHRSALQEGEEGRDSSSSHIPHLSASALWDALRSDHARSPPAPFFSEARTLPGALSREVIDMAEDEVFLAACAAARAQPKLPPPPPPSQSWREGS